MGGVMCHLWTHCVICHVHVINGLWGASMDITAGNACVQTGHVSEPSGEFCYEPKTTLRNKVY